MDLHRPVEGNKSYDMMTPEEKLRYDHQKMHELHRGHDSMHMKMVLILIGTLVVAQIIVVEWKKLHYRSYAFFTMVSMWSIPLLISTYNHSYRFIIVWTIFTLLTSLVIWKSSQKPMSNTTPRMVYKWFYLIYKVSCFFMLFGYVVMVLTFLSVNVVFNHRPQSWMDVGLMCMFYGVYFGVLGRDVAEYCTDKMAASIGVSDAVEVLTFLSVNVVFNHRPQSWMDVGLMCMFYGVYFGVLGRDVAEYCTDKMAASIGYYTKEGMPTRHLESNVCAVCGNKLLVDVNEEGVLGFRQSPYCFVDVP
ncbi:E3 ubiquitin ligase Rnf121 isoform X2 [Maniola hyperantus]|uniref:E3 ubiquitin ligase Rnf121 isoform X2 n=1 Tax=Aphantopus hyperantus TaxID=2795564 RepID=UPI0037493092